ncbi:MAG: hypothetical protein OER77_08905 [Myxococcales bacterium]|nr:hypothetical protein [Myxococcales bacterium]
MSMRTIVFDSESLPVLAVDLRSHETVRVRLTRGLTVDRDTDLAESYARI